jgi:hypothetical protein
MKKVSAKEGIFKSGQTGKVLNPKGGPLFE